MSSKIMIINWRFKKGEKVIVKQEYKVEKVDYIVKCYNYENQNCTIFIYELNSTIKTVDNEYLILLHKGNGIFENNIINSINKKCKICEFDRNTARIYKTDNNPEGLLGLENIDPKAMNNKEIYNKNFNHVWNYFWNQIPLEELKQKIISHWLPLAIDIQGLHDVKDNEQKLKDYWKDIKNSKPNYSDLYKKYEEIIQNCDEIINLDRITEKNEILEQNLKSLDNVKELDKSFKDNFLDPEGELYIPRWLEELANQLN